MVSTRSHHHDDQRSPKQEPQQARQEAQVGDKRSTNERDNDNLKDDNTTTSKPDDKKPKLGHGDTKPTANDHHKAESGQLPPDAFAKDLDDDGQRRHGVLERGHVYFVYKPKVQLDEVESVDDVAQLMTIGRKYLPKRTEGQKQKQSDICYGKVLSVSDDMSNLKDSLGKTSYETKTQGTRHVGPGRVAGSGVYIIYSSKAPDAPKNTQNASALYQTYLAYAVGVPHDLGKVQQDLHIEHEGAFQVQVKNPSAPSTNPRVPDQPADKQPKYPKVLADLFTTRYIPSNPPALLNYAGTELLLLPSKRDVVELLGQDGEQELQKELEHEMPSANVKHEQTDDNGEHDEQAREEARQALEEVGLEGQIEGKALEGYWE
ncbi:hypothetical protein OIO90_001630 [Microbotryomycetes sp. JL221]|nr:hypothetical protein OIO90_001630 [Microbotryomycetes sp. JL221]